LGFLALVVLILITCSAASAQQTVPASPLERLAADTPRVPADCTAERTKGLAASAEAVEQSAAAATWNGAGDNPRGILRAIESLIDAKMQVDARLEQVLALRNEFADVPSGAARLEMLRQYLQTTSKLIDLSGRMRYLLRDAINNASYDLTPYPAVLDEMLDMLVEHQVSVGASVMTYALFDPPADSGVQPFGEDLKRKVLTLMAASRDVEVLSHLAAFISDPATPAELVVMGALVVRELGLPQDPPSGNGTTGSEPAITAEQLYRILSRLNSSELSPAMAAHRRDLMTWLTVRIKQGVVEDSYRLGGMEVRAGDWILMRNPSPYNLFTDLSPGLFTHVGVVTTQQDEQGIQRFVVVDLPERGDRIPAHNVDAYVQRTLHYFFLRHEDPAVGRKMGEVARSLIGNETEFDLLFRTDRVQALKGQPLEGRRINTYCAGLLLICAQETSAPREGFFPIAESPAGGNCLQNLRQLGLSIGDNFVSPSGAIFSPHLEIVGRREPMYDPGREIKEAIYDHFAQSMIHKHLQPSPDAWQWLRQKVAGVSQGNRWLARALARANNVSEHMDLQSAAKAAAVIETLDEIAEQQMNDYYAAREAIQAGTVEQLSAEGLEARQIEQTRRYRELHKQLFQQWTSGQMNPRQLRIELVNYYCAAGNKQLDDRFFRTAAP
jgi:hypothetical protein